MHHSPEKSFDQTRFSSSSNTSTPSPGNPSSEEASNSFFSPGANSKIDAPYIPSYMDLTNGPEPCVVCGDAATGYHYRCMTCEGCKGFFRRTIQKNLQYHCKWNGQCSIDKNTRNQCQQCRFQKCIRVGMATDLVLNEKQRVAKRKLIEDNRERRRQEQTVQSTRVKQQHENCIHDCLTNEDKILIAEIMKAYSQTNTSQNYIIPEREILGRERMGSADPKLWKHLAEVMTPSIIRVVEFAKKLPGFNQLDLDDQILLLKSSCMEIMCLRAAYKYDVRNGLSIMDGEKDSGFTLLIEPIREFAIGLSKLQLDDTEVALLAAVLLMQADRSGLKNQEEVESIQDSILGAYKRYISEKRPHQPIHWAKVLMKITDLRSITSKHAEKIMNIKLDQAFTMPQQVANVFEGATSVEVTSDYLPSYPSWPLMPLHHVVPNMTSKS
ncbi:DgyrCDS6843 [Dimorphilus gyrociliatus]|uniref:DgyrCDS6843 n=1 Tax=Dimorphilus gyrociliatus TaxID=2664684 RepID=A0A7I8VU40_9ANNE|nr:DgyrCDS6843 [Dimorphilus gyrociliatus]